MISIFDIFKIGLGPSSSHTVGPMKAAADFAARLCASPEKTQVARVAIEVYGSLALTGRGHGTFDALMLGLEGSAPDTVELSKIPQRMARIYHQGQLFLNGEVEIHFEASRDISTRYQEVLPKHPNGLRFLAYDHAEHCLAAEIYYSIGGGFIVTDEQFGLPESAPVPVPFPFRNADELLRMCTRENQSIAQIVMANEIALSGEDEASVRYRVRRLADAMIDCVQRGLHSTGKVLPGGLNVRRRAPALAQKMLNLRIADRVNTHLWPLVFAMAVNEENAAGGRVVTAPTNGASGVIPAVMTYFRYFHPYASNQGVEDFLLTAGAIGILYKTNASISGADVGCQGEVGVACSMAAGAFSAVSGGTPTQVENAAEMAMEHLLGLTCDPVGGLVQIPCIERNGIAAESAIRFAALSLLEDGHDKKVSLDEVIRTMLQTGRDMKDTYKETALAGLAATLKQKPITVSVKVVEC
ncbi:MAG: L-serine ammonia-lyase [Neisseria sp.]|nr:L-serine ammonia-lyase [Neisseria sp.]